VAALAVVLAYRSPLPFAEVWPPLFPEGLVLSRLLKPDLLRGHRTPCFQLKRKTEHVFVMPRNRLKLVLLGREKRLALVPGVFDTRQDPEVAFRVQHDPLL